MLSHRARVGAASGIVVAAVTVGLAPPGAAQPAPRNQASQVVTLTGASSINQTEARYEVKGTDLGIMWTDERGQILAAFGDTFGAGWAGSDLYFTMTQYDRYNVSLMHATLPATSVNPATAP